MVPLFLWFYFEKSGIVLTVFGCIYPFEIIMLALMTASS